MAFLVSIAPRAEDQSANWERSTFFGPFDSSDEAERFHTHLQFQYDSSRFVAYVHKLMRPDVVTDVLASVDYD